MNASPPILLRFNEIVGLFDEPLHTSCRKFHFPYEPPNDKDPLSHYGVLSDGTFPDLSLEETDILRDVVIRWETRHTACPFGTRYDTIKAYATFFSENYYDHSSLTQIVPRPMSRYSSTCWSVGADTLMAVGHMSLGIVQILETLSGFWDPSMGSAFVLDPRFKFLQILEEHHDPSVSLLALQALQTRTSIAVKRINAYLRYLQMRYAPGEIDDSEAVESLYSMVSSERAVFGQESGEEELGKLLARPQYKLAI
ncbi:hypothetical protein K435DRAFT_692297, partial [Dendrothele bispora CBS 962.96]